uniref:Putative secreted protein n=1 Tax=Ixodes ricinus TaxID=34613 RepID=A0A6B0U1F3_IXORI
MITTLIKRLNVGWVVALKIPQMRLVFVMKCQMALHVETKRSALLGCAQQCPRKTETSNIYHETFQET